jgi:hypothetical protein
MSEPTCWAIVRGAAGDRQCRRAGCWDDHIHGTGVIAGLCPQHHNKLHRSGLWLSLGAFVNWVHKQTRWCANCDPGRQAERRDG